MTTKKIAQHTIGVLNRVFFGEVVYFSHDKNYWAAAFFLLLCALTWQDVKDIAK